MLRMMEYLSACLASRGSNSQMRMPSTLVAIGLSRGPQYSLPASGLGSKVSRCAGPPHIQIWMTDLALAAGVAAGLGLAAKACADALRVGASASPATPNRPSRMASRREIGRPEVDSSR